MSPSMPAVISRRQEPLNTSRTASVSVIIPCFNYARFLPESIMSALTQQGVEVDVTVVDDASTDDSLAIARSYEPDIAVLSNTNNNGPVETFNRGLGHARGEFLVRLDADDILTPGSLQRAVAVMEAEPDVGLVYGHAIRFSGSVRPKARCTSQSWTIWKGIEWLSARCRAGNNVITSPEVVMRKSVVDRVGGQRPLAHTHDMEMWLRIAAYADIAYVNGADQAWHREHDESLSKKAEDPLIILSEIRDAFDTLFEEVGPDIPSSKRLHEEARYAVARKALAYARCDIDRGNRSIAAQRLTAFAAACWPDIDKLPEGRSHEAAFRRMESLPRPIAAMTGLMPRLLRRLEDHRSESRWKRTGVYEKLKLRKVYRETLILATNNETP